MAKKTKKKKPDSDPYKIIEEFFSANDLDHYRKYISSMLKAAYSDNYWKKSDPGSLLFFQEHMEKLIRAARQLVNSDGKPDLIYKQAILEEPDMSTGMDPSTYFGWHKDSSMWEFFPRNLTKKEFINPYLAIKRFFKFKDLKTWMKDFKELITYTLSPYGNESAIDFDYLGINRHLQKLVEACHLIEVRTNKKEQLRIQKANSPEKQKEEDVIDCEQTEEPNSYTSDPYQIIDRFFMDGDIQDGREDINRLFEAAFPDDLIVKKHYPSNLVFTYERIDKLIDAAYTISQESENINIKTNSKKSETEVLVQVKAIFKKVKNWDLFPYKLKPYEWINPRLAIRAFFDHQPISHWKGKLHELLQACIRNESICEVISDRSKLYLDCEHLERLVEAVWVIRVMEC